MCGDTGPTETDTELLVDRPRETRLLDVGLRRGMVEERGDGGGGGA